MPLIDPVTRADFLVIVQGLQSYWQSFSGVDDQSQTSVFSDGFDRRMYDRVGPRKLQPITLTKGYDPDQDDAIVDFWNAQQSAPRGNQGVTVSVQPVQYLPDPQNLGTPVVLFGFRPTQFKGWEADKTSQDTSLLTLVGVISNWSKGR